MSEDTKKFLAAGALGLGAAGGAAAVSNTDGKASALQQPSQVLVFAYDYHPSLAFQVVNRLQQETVNDILGQSVGQNGDPVVSDPTEYNGYIVQYQGGGSAGEYTLVFVRDQTLSTDQSYQFNAGDATFFNTDINLLQAGLTAGEEAETTPEAEETTPEEEETTPEQAEEETTPEAEETTPEETPTPAEDEEETTPEGDEQEEVVVETTPEEGGG